MEGCSRNSEVRVRGNMSGQETGGDLRLQLLDEPMKIKENQICRHLHRCTGQSEVHIRIQSPCGERAYGKMSYSG